MSRDSKTRSGLLWEVERLLKEMDELPQILLMENVPDVLSEKFVKDFAEWIAFLDAIGYTSKYAVLNAKDYGIPQNRERCFMVSWQGDFFYDFPAPVKSKLCLADMLEKEVEESYFMKEQVIEMYDKHYQRNLSKGNGFGWKPINTERERESNTIRCSNHSSNSVYIAVPVHRTSEGAW